MAHKINKVLLVASLTSILFLAAGVVELTLALLIKNTMHDTPTSGQQAVSNQIYEMLPLTAGMVNGGFIIATWLATLPGLLMRSSRRWLTFAGYMVTISAVFTLCVGVYLWIMTLRIGRDFFDVYVQLEPEVQELIQTSFTCCGYMDSSTPAFVTDATCPSPAAAALLRGCQTSVASFANVLLDDIFTAVFGAVGLDVIFVLVLACLSKDRKEREWYIRIDQKKSYW